MIFGTVQTVTPTVTFSTFASQQMDEESDAGSPSARRHLRLVQ